MRASWCFHQLSQDVDIQLRDIWTLTKTGGFFFLNFWILFCQLAMNMVRSYKVLLTAPLFPMGLPLQTDPHIWFGTDKTGTGITLACEPLKTEFVFWTMHLFYERHRQTTTPHSSENLITKFTLRLVLTSNACHIYHEFHIQYFKNE